MPSPCTAAEPSRAPVRLAVPSSGVTIRLAADTAVPGQGCRTVLVIAHQLETIRAAGQILFLDAGRIVEADRHDQLLAARGPYAHFWAARSQASGWSLQPG